MAKLQYYTYNADGQRTRRKIDGVETWQIYGFDGELLAEYAANASSLIPQKEYGYRNGQLLITAEPSGAPSGPQNVAWTSVAATLQVTGNSLQKVGGGASWNDAGAVSTQAIPAGEGYVEFTPGNTVTNRMIGLGNDNSNYHYSDIEFAFYVSASGLRIYEAGTDRGSFFTYRSTDRLRVGVEGGVVKYRKNGMLLYTSTVAPVYPLLVDTSLNTVNSELIDVLTPWSISFCTPGLYLGSKIEPYRLSDGRGALGLREGVEIHTCHGVEQVSYYESEKTPNRGININESVGVQNIPVGYNRGHVFSTAWLPPGRSVILSVPREHLAKHLGVYLSFKYEWETAENDSGNNEPEHRVYFRASDLPEKIQTNTK